MPITLFSHTRQLPYLAIGLLTFNTTVMAQWFERDFKVMGTTASVELWHDSAREADKRISDVEQEMRRIEQLMSPFIESSELSRINREAARNPVTVSRELFGLIKTSLQFSQLTEGAFDITFSSVGYLYDYRKHTRPDEKQLQSHLATVDYHHVLLDESNMSVSFDLPGVRIDLGGIAKGYAVQRCIELLKEQGVLNAYVNAGGDSFVLGDRRGRPWLISIKHPRDSTQSLSRLPLTDAAISTSGDYERYFDDENGVRYHHIINPKTGDSARETLSATIIAADATTSDALSTSVFVMGVEEGLALIDSLPNISAIVVDKNGKIYYSRDLLEMLGKASP